MGTRSTVKIYSEYNNDKPLLSVYQQYDGYPSGVGIDLAQFLKGKQVINGISTNHREGGYANGMGCLAAQYVAENKTEIGGFYMTTEDDAQEYNYEVRYKEGKYNIKCNDDFEGDLETFITYCEEN